VACGAEQILIKTLVGSALDRCKKELKGKPGENRRRKATELMRLIKRDVSGAAKCDKRESAFKFAIFE
jgi:hypothetical protein